MSQSELALRTSEAATFFKKTYLDFLLYYKYRLSHKIRITAASTDWYNLWIFHASARCKHRIIPICTRSGNADFVGKLVAIQPGRKETPYRVARVDNTVQYKDDFSVE